MNEPTLRQVLFNADQQSIFQHIFQIDEKCDNAPESVDIVANNYRPVINELLSIPTSPPDWSLRVYWTTPFVHPTKPILNEPSHLDADLVNPNYEGEPPKDLKPWGGDHTKKDDCPEGHFNVNWEGYVSHFGMGFTEWDKMIDSEITKPDDISWEQALAVFLWELTFYGWTWEKQKEVRDEIYKRNKDYEEAKKDGRIEIKENAIFGKYDVVSIKPRDDEITGSD
jgi:hypothetical protein